MLERIKGLKKNRFETRAFAYLDIISWLENKVQHKPMDRIVYEKYLKNKRKLQAASFLQKINLVGN